MCRFSKIKRPICLRCTPLFSLRLFSCSYRKMSEEKGIKSPEDRCASPGRFNWRCDSTATVLVDVGALTLSFPVFTKLCTYCQQFYDSLHILQTECFFLSQSPGWTVSSTANHWSVFVRAVLTCHIALHVYDLTARSRGGGDGGGVNRREGCQASDSSSRPCFNISASRNWGQFTVFTVF